MFKVVALTQNELIEREATFSHREDALQVAETWYKNGHDLVRMFATDDGEMIHEWVDA